MYGSLERQETEANCKQCSKGRYNDVEGLAKKMESESVCKACVLGFEQIEAGKSYCLPCVPVPFPKN